MRRLALLLALGLSAACAGREAREEPRERPAVLSTGPAPTGLPLEELPAQTLTRGQCALVLWSRTTPARRLFLAVNAPASARVQVGGRTLVLPRTATSGPEVFGHHSSQTYGGSGLALVASAEFDAREGLVGGAAVPAAALTVRTADGTETVIAAAGLLACQS